MPSHEFLLVVFVCFRIVDDFGRVAHENVLARPVGLSQQSLLCAPTKYAPPPHPLLTSAHRRAPTAPTMRAPALWRSLFS